MLRKAFDFFVFTSLFIACCAVLMVYQAAMLFQQAFPFSIYAFVFCGSVCSYNFHWFLTPPNVSAVSYKLRWNISHRTLHLGLAFTGLIGAGICAVLLIEHWLWLALTAFFTFLYSAPMIAHPLFTWLRKIAVGKTIYLAAAWTHVTTSLPLIIETGTLSGPQWLYTINRFFFIYAICIVFDRRDVVADRKAGVKSLITYFTPKAVDRLFWFSSCIALVTNLWLFKWMNPFDIVALLVPLLVLSALYQPSKQSRSDYLYYFLLDGLMALSAPILILAKFAR